MSVTLTIMLSYTVLQGFMLSEDKAIFTHKSNHEVVSPDVLPEMVETMATTEVLDFAGDAEQGMYLYEDDFFIHYELDGLCSVCSFALA